MSKIKTALLSMEMMLPVLPEPCCGANFRGGLGILAGDFMAGMQNTGFDGIGFVPLYHRPWFQKNTEVDYENLPLFKKLVVSIDSHDYVVYIRKISIRGSMVYGLECHDVFDVLYTEDRRRRLLQEIVFAKAAPQIMKDTSFQPDVVWLNESHTALMLPQVREDSYFENTKVLFTIHTPEPAGMEKFYEYRFDQLGIPEHYRAIFVKDGLLDLTWAAMVLADKVNAVSREHAVTTIAMFPQFRSKISGIVNGSDRQFWLHPSLSVCDSLLLRDRQPLNSSDAAVLLRQHKRIREPAFSYLEKISSVALDPIKPTAWFVRRFAAYKNLYNMLYPILPAVCADRGKKVATDLGPLEGLGMQVVGAGMAAENDNTCLWWTGQFTHLAREDLYGRFVFLPYYNLELLKLGAQASDVWLVTPEPIREACGTSDQRAAMNGIPSITTKTGGMMEYVQEFDGRRGNGFFVDPYEPKTVYEKLKQVSDLWYAWLEQGDLRYGQLCLNAFSAGVELDILGALVKYQALMQKMM